MDFELLNQSSTGLEIIEELGIGTQSILVTSRYEEDRIREHCEKLGVRLIPKTMAGFVPIEIEKPKEFFDAILLDDDEISHMTWKIIAEEKGKKFIGFYKPEDFFHRTSEFNFESPLFIDSNLGYGIKGEDIAHQTHLIGFKNIYLCTGYDPNTFPIMPYLKGIIGKAPIW